MKRWAWVLIGAAILAACVAASLVPWVWEFLVYGIKGYLKQFHGN